MSRLCRSKTNTARLIAAALGFGSMLAGCSDLYFDRRETIALGAEDAVAANIVTQMVDPWPRYSNNNNIAFNGERMQKAVQCYRSNAVTPPADLNTSSAAYQSLIPPAPPAKCGSAPPAASSQTQTVFGPGGNAASTTTTQVNQ